MAHLVRHAAVDHVLDEAMAVGRHGDEIAGFARRRIGYLLGRVTTGEQRLRLDADGRIDDLNQSATRLLGVGSGIGEGYYSGVGVGGVLPMPSGPWLSTIAGATCGV